MTKKKIEMPTNLRYYMRQTQVRLILGGILLLFLVGDGLIYLIYGARSAFMGLLCIGAGLLPIMVIVIILWIMEEVVKRNRGY